MNVTLTDRYTTTTVTTHISKDPETLQLELELMLEKTEEPGEYSRKRDGENC